MALILDTGALVALDRGERWIAVLIDEMAKRNEPIFTSSGCIAQAWRTTGPRHARMAMSLRTVDQLAIDENNSRALGQLCARSGIDDVVDAHVASLVQVGDLVLTSDDDDMRALLDARGVRADISHC